MQMLSLQRIFVAKNYTAIKFLNTFREKYWLTIKSQFWQHSRHHRKPTVLSQHEIEFYVYFLNACHWSFCGMNKNLTLHFVFFFIIHLDSNVCQNKEEKFCRNIKFHAQNHCKFWPNRTRSVNQSETLSHWSWASGPSLMSSPEFLAENYYGFSSLQ